MNVVEFNGWRRNACLSNGEMELIVTLEVGPRILRCGFAGKRNMFAEIAGQQGGRGEKEWMIRGGHRLWIAPELKPDTYELDNVPVRTEEIAGGIRTIQPAGPITGIARTMEICVDMKSNRASIRHVLRNEGKKPKTLSPWTPSVMSPGGEAVIPLPAKVPHTERLTHNQEWSIWSYTDLSDRRWKISPRYVRFSHDPALGPNKLGIAHREGWVGYLLDGFLFVKRFKWVEGAAYPDGGVNFETFACQDFLELESLGPLVTLKPGEEAVHDETWLMFRDVPRCGSDADLDRHVRALAAG